MDQLGQVALADRSELEVLFCVVSMRHLRRRPIVVTTNKHLAALAQVLHDSDLAEAILDRLRRQTSSGGIAVRGFPR
jgi:DNA replication protein DnaC